MSEVIHMVDLKSQYLKIRDQIDKEVLDIFSSGQFINGPQVDKFVKNLSNYLDAPYVIPCGNGTDALQIAIMALNLEKGDEVICPSFTYVATAEVLALLGLKPIMADVDPSTFNITAEIIEPLITAKTKLIVPVHLFGQSCDMEPIIQLAKKYNLYVIEDNAQSIGSTYNFSNGDNKSTGTMGDMGTLSFFPSKNLGCYGDGGAIITRNKLLADRARMIANHGQSMKYTHNIIGCNSRLDTIQAAILDVKLKYLDKFNKLRNQMAQNYDKAFLDLKNKGLQIPVKSSKSNHVYHQYTLRVNETYRKDFIEFLNFNGIPAMIYYPIPLYQQEAFKSYVPDNFRIVNVEKLCKEVVSLPIHTEIETSKQDYIIDKVQSFFQSI